MKELLKYSLPSLLVLVFCAVFLIAFMQGCFQKKQDMAQPIVIVHSDTGSQQVRGSNEVHPALQPIVIATQQPSQPQTNTIREIIYKNDTAEINRILTHFFSKNAYSNTLKIDTIGTVTVNDTISQNAIEGRSYTYNLKYPVITNTITIDHPYVPRNQLYAGAGITGNQADLLTSFKAGVLLKNKKDNVIEINATLNKSMMIGGEIGFYKLISFRKKK